MRRRRDTIVCDRAAGFTLLEILVTIVISAILAVILVQVMTNQSGRSFQPLAMFAANLELNSAMEKITADYRSLVTNSLSVALQTLQDRVNGGVSSGYWPAGSAIVASENYCLNDPGSAASADPCGAADKLLKVTLVNGHLSLSALFARH